MSLLTAYCLKTLILFSLDPDAGVFRRSGLKSIKELDEATSTGHAHMYRHVPSIQFTLKWVGEGRNQSREFVHEMHLLQPIKVCRKSNL
jgi:hypothetical protein